MKPAPPVIRMFLMSLLGSNLVDPMSPRVSFSYSWGKDKRASSILGLSGGVRVAILMSLFLKSDMLGLLVEEWMGLLVGLLIGK